MDFLKRNSEVFKVIGVVFLALVSLSATYWAIGNVVQQRIHVTNNQLSEKLDRVLKLQEEILWRLENTDTKMCTSQEK